LNVRFISCSLGGWPAESVCVSMAALCAPTEASVL